MTRIETPYYKFVQNKVPTDKLPIKCIDPGWGDAKFLLVYEEGEKDKYIGIISKEKKVAEYLKTTANLFPHAIELLELAVDYFDGEDEEWLESAKELLEKINK